MKNTWDTKYTHKVPKETWNDAKFKTRKNQTSYVANQKQL